MPERPLIVLALVLASGAFSNAAIADEPLAKTIKSRQGKPTTLLLESGVELTGNVVSVGDDTVRLKALGGREFFDAEINLDKVQAVIYRAPQ